MSGMRRRCAIAWKRTFKGRAGGLPGLYLAKEKDGEAMAGKSKLIYQCRECGFESAKWMGKCPSCGEWNSFEEAIK